MQDSLSIGPVPSDEQCEQLGPNYSPTRARSECKAFMAQLIRQFGAPPPDAYLRIKANPHDFGSYLEVEVVYSDEDEDAVKYAFDMENNSPTQWDAEARRELAHIIPTGG
jgi:hypothetical protein